MVIYGLLISVKGEKFNRKCLTCHSLNLLGITTSIWGDGVGILTTLVLLEDVPTKLITVSSRSINSEWKSGQVLSQRQKFHYIIKLKFVFPTGMSDRTAKISEQISKPLDFLASIYTLLQKLQYASIVSRWIDF